MDINDNGNKCRPIDGLAGEISSRENVEEAFDYVVGHLENAKQKAKYRPQREAICGRLQKELADGTFRIGEFRDMEVTDGPKVRQVQAPRVYGRIGCHAVMVVVERYVYPTLIKNTAASIKGRGMHWLHHIEEADTHNAPEKTKYYYQCDIRHFYDNIPQERMKALIREYICDRTVLPMLDSFIELIGKGLSKGLRSSQCMANLYLSSVDRRMQEEAERYTLTDEDGEEKERLLYYRYCDDMVLKAGDKKTLWRLRDILVEEVEALGLSIKQSEAVRPMSEGLDFLGYVDYGTHSLLRKRTKQNAARKLARVKSRKRRQTVIGSFKGMACHADCKHLFFVLTGQRMRKFGEMGITYTPKDGKKRFAGRTMRLSSIQNKTVEIHDYETGMNTRHGDGRYLVSFRDVQSGEWGKFFTASEEMQDMLDQAGAMDGGLPFETVIVSETFDNGKMKYRFT